MKDLKTRIMELNDIITNNKLKPKTNGDANYKIFDYDPQEPAYSDSKIKEMVELFDNETEFGKLYINYPMMQSYRHLKKMPDIDFINRKIAREDASKYKDIVNNESYYKNLGKYNYPVFMGIIGHHLMKANYILNRKYELMSKDEFINLDYTKIYDIEWKSNRKNNVVDVLNTFVFFIVEYNSTRMLEKVKQFM